jgi:hypothetical protein
MDGIFGFRGPDQQAADRMSPIQGIEESLYLIAIPHIASLEFGESHVAVVNVIEDG